MIHYHGAPITPDVAAVQILQGRHGLVSFAYSSQIALVAEVCQSFVLDNGAFTFWKRRKPIDWDEYYGFVDEWLTHPGFDWALIPDIIDGTEDANDRLVADWPFSKTFGVPVWHFHESLGRLVTLSRNFDRIALGSSGEYATVGTATWWGRMADVMATICQNGRPLVKLHGLRMLNPKVFTRIPLSSADSSNIARNIGIDVHWRKGSYPPPTKAARGLVMAQRIENQQSAERWGGM